MDEPKYTSCHIEEQAIKQQHQQHYATNSAVIQNCHPDDGDNNLGVLKTEDGVSHNHSNYVLPPFLN